MIIETISERLKSVIGLVTPVRSVADVGCDHGYVAISLIESGRAQRVIAMDVNKGPLQRAREHIAECGMNDRIETRLSDGLHAAAPGEAQAVVCAGMGGKLMIGILERGAAVVKAASELILQPQSDIALVRAYLRDISFTIEAEEMVCEDGKFYPMMRAVPCKQNAGPDEVSVPDETTQRLFDTYGPILLQRADQVLNQFLTKEQQVYTDILNSLSEGADSESSRLRRLEVQEKLDDIEQVRNRFYGRR